jgi:hypothetical protein
MCHVAPFQRVDRLDHVGGRLLRAEPRRGADHRHAHRDADRTPSFLALRLCEGRDVVDRARDRANALGRCEPEPNRFGGGHRAVGHEVVGEPAKPPFDRDQQLPCRDRLKLVKREAVKRVDNRRNPDAPRRDPAQATGFRAVGVNEVEVPGREMVTELVHPVQVGPRQDPPLGRHVLQRNDLEAAVFRPVGEHVGLAREDRRLETLWVECERAPECDPARAGGELRHDLGDSHLSRPSGLPAPQRRIGGGCHVPASTAAATVETSASLI